MAYATVIDMIQRFGEAELIRCTTPEGQPADAIDQDRVNQVLDDASDTIDSFLRRRYAVPVTTAASIPSLKRTCCIIARVDLSQTGSTQPTDEMRQDRRDAMLWLKQLGEGTATLDGAIASSTPGAFARTSDRNGPLSRGRCL